MKRLTLILTAVLMLMLLCSAVTVSAFAKTYSGKCGDDVTWSLDTETGVLTISGTGAMYDYTYSNRSPWYSSYYRSSIILVIINDGVTTIGANAFENCSNLTDVIIPDGIKTIGVSAFEVCSSLANITIPNSVTTIGEGAFYDCDSLTRFVIPDGVIAIKTSAFEDCDGLTSIEIPKSVTSIGSSAFYDCSRLTSITFLNSQTVISDFMDPISDTATIYGYEGSTAQEFAEKYDRRFVVIGNKISLGDLDGDGVITKDDAIYLLYNSLFGDEAYPLNQDVDYNGDGVITKDDAIYLLYNSLFGSESYPLE